MDKSAIRKFSVAARKKLIDAVKQKAYEVGVLDTDVKDIQRTPDGFVYNGVLFDKKIAEQREQLIQAIENRSDGKGYRHGYDLLTEEVAYTWFNRLIALRFMEVNEYLPSNIRILSSATSGKIEPDVIHEADYLDFVDKEKTAELFGNDEKLYRYILIAQCNALSAIMPKMFEKIEDYTELLLPDKLYTKDGIVYDLVHEIDEDDFKSQVEIIGWLYQYYISEKKDDVFTALKKNVKITKENIPAATQLFTPDWIVKYMVENSLGRLFVEKLHINPADFDWKYYLPEAEQTEDVYEQLKILNENGESFDIQNVKLVDPCMGSGHILVYAFDLFHQMYSHLGYSEREIPQLILSNNIYGLDLDDRAGQLAYFALMMKARNCHRQFFKDENNSAGKINVYSIIESDAVPKEHLEVLNNADITSLYEIFADSKEYGSLLKFDKEYDFEKLENYIRNFQFKATLDTYSLNESKSILLEILQISKILTQKYDIVVTNPPYMGGKGMSKTLSDFVKENYPDSKSDLFAVFIEKCNELLKNAGYQAMITQHSWMFLSSFEKLRTKLVNRTIINMAHLGARAFEEIGGEVVQTTAFVYRNCNVTNYKSTFVRLVDFNTQKSKEEEFLAGNNQHIANQENFKKIPGMPLAYWASGKMLGAFSGTHLDDYANCCTGMQTGNNDKYVRAWFEVNYSKTAMFSQDGVYKRYNCGGESRKWYGNHNNVVFWENDGAAIKAEPGSVIRNEKYFYKAGISWKRIGSADFDLRFLPEGFIIDQSGDSMFLYKKEDMNYILGYVNSKVALNAFQFIAPTLNLTAGNMNKLPVIMKPDQRINDVVVNNVMISHQDWDFFETSWDFVRHPLVKGVFKLSLDNVFAEKYIEASYVEWKSFTESQFLQLKANEEELNRIFIDIYGLQDELTPEVEDKNITVRKADLQRDIKSFISYAVGCMFGRYSLDVEGLVFAGGDFDESKYKTFIPDMDNIIPITENDYFDDDIVSRFIEFVRVVYSEETLEDNLVFISNALYPTGKTSSRDLIRKYFVNDFYPDHVKMYQKKPIYWQFESGKQGGFKALIYLHRYEKYTVPAVRTDYLHPLQRKYDAEIKNLEMRIGLGSTADKDKTKYQKEIIELKKKIDECRLYDQVMAHIAHQAIELDLDDGVTVNYAKFQDVEVPQDGQKNLKMNLLTKI